MKTLSKVLTVLVLLGLATPVAAQFSGPSNTRITIRETTKTLPAGLWSIGSIGDGFKIEKNTSATGNFGSTVAVFSASGGTVTVTLPNGAASFTFPTTNGTNDYALTTNGSGTTSWAAIVNSVTGTANQVATSAAGGNITLSLAGPHNYTTLTSNGVLYGNGTGAIQATTQGPANSVLTANAGAPTFSATPTLTSVTATNFIIGANTLNTSEWANLDGINQTVATTSTPQFARLGLGGAADANIILTTTRAGVNTQFSNTSGHAVGNEILRLRYDTTSSVTGDSGKISITNLSNTEIASIESINDISGGGMAFGTFDNGGSTMRRSIQITGAGNVGVGVAAPASSNGSVGRLLEVGNTGNLFSGLVLSSQPTSGSGIGGLIEARHTGSVTGDARIGQIIFSRTSDVTGGKISGFIDFYTNSDGTLTLQTRIQRDGMFIPGGDNTKDLGLVSGARWRSAFFGTGLSIGSNVPTVGGALAIGLANAGIIAGRNAVGNANINIIGTDASDRVVISTSGNDIMWGRAVIALGGGATATMGTIGGSGPATSAQKEWLQVITSTGVTRFIALF